MTSLVSPWRRAARGRLVLAAVGFSLHQACEALVPIVVGIVIDVAIGGSDPVALVWTIVALCAVFTVLLWSWRMGELTATGLYVDTGYRARRALVSRLLHPLTLAPRRPGETLSTLTNDVDDAASAGWAVGRGIAYSVAIATAATGLLLISVPLGIGVLVATPLLLTVMHFVTKPLERRSRAEQEALAEASALTTDLLSGLRVVKGLRAEDEAASRFHTVNRRTLATAVRAANAEGIFAGTSTLLSGLFLVALAGASAAAVLAGAISIGQLVTVVGLAQVLQGPLSWLGFVGAELARARASRVRVDELAASALREDAPAPVAGAGALRFRDVHAAALSGLDLDVPAGSHLGIDADEAAAADISALLTGTISPQRGEITVDGTPLRRPPGPEHAVVSSPHEAALLSGTVADNVGTREHEPVAQAAALADVLAVDGWDRQVGERGRLLSGGQRQRVALARALATDAPVLALHEPTTAVDAVTEARIADGIRTLRAERTTVLITRSPTLLGICDRVVIVRDGRLFDDDSPRGTRA